MTDRRDLPAGISVTELSALPHMVMPLTLPSADALHDHALAAAWTAGAWDICVTVLPPLGGTDLGLVGACMDYGCDQGLRIRLLEAAERGRLVTWLWLPMVGNPLRLARHGPKDSTIEPDGRRQGPPPEDLPRPKWDWRGAREWTIRLGQWSDAHRPRQREPRPRVARPMAATINQINYIYALRRRAGEPAGNPMRMTYTEASAEIDALKDRL